MNNHEKIAIVLNDDREIKLELNSEAAPLTVKHFLKLVDEKYFDGLIFHRIIKDFMIQGGGYFINDQNQLLDAKEIQPVKGEFRQNGWDNPIKHETGVISMARTSDPNSATGQFFICSANCPWLDGAYAAFGKTIDEESKNLVIEISNMPTGFISNEFQDFPQYDVSIKTIKRI